jgi:TPP-dependent pyruvate/acetoin dehydrogenase alpha subunit
MGPHSSSDDPTRYRDEKLYQAWTKRDPIKRLRAYLESKNIWDEKKEKNLQEDLKAKLAEAVERAEKEPAPDPMDLFEDVYAELTPQLKKQRAELLHEVELRGKFENTSEAFPL